jgi:hypothetical protein
VLPTEPESGRSAGVVGNRTQKGGRNEIFQEKDKKKDREKGRQKSRERHREQGEDKTEEDKERKSKPKRCVHDDKESPNVVLGHHSPSTLKETRSLYNMAVSMRATC